jgi:hypothetical protein
METGVQTLFADSIFSTWLVTLWVLGTTYVVWRVVLVLYDQCVECTQRGFSNGWPRVVRQLCMQTDTEATFMSTMLKMWGVFLFYGPLYLAVIALWPAVFAPLVLLAYLPYFDAIVYLISTAFALIYTHDKAKKAMGRSPFEALPDAAREVWFYARLVYHYVVAKIAKKIKWKRN